MASLSGDHPGSSGCSIAGVGDAIGGKLEAPFNTPTPTRYGCSARIATDEGETVLIVDRRRSGLYVPSRSSSDEPDPLRPWSEDEYAAQLDGLRFFAENPELRCIWEFQPSEGSLAGLSLEPGASRTI